MGKLRPRKSAHLAKATQWDHEFGSRKSSFGTIPFTGKFYYPQTAENSSFLRIKYLNFMAHSLGFKVEVSPKVDLK